MKINAVSIRHFGKLEDFSLSFQDGFNVLYGENEQGKSTVMAFIRMMLYGNARSEKDLSRNLRRKYTPWDGSKMGGSLEFTHEGVLYRLEKTFGETPKNDVVKLWNLSANKAEPLNEQREIGRRFFGMGEDAFERSVFIGQIGSVIDNEKDKENEIIQKLQNLASSGDETQSFHLVDSRLQAAAEKIRSKGGKIGALDRLTQAWGRLQDEKAEAADAEAEKERMRQAYQELTARKEAIDAELNEKKRTLEEIRIFRKYRDLEKILLKKKEAEDLEKECAALQESLVSGDFRVGSDFLDEAERQLRELDRLQTVLGSRGDDLARQEKASNEASPADGDGISKEAFDEAEALQAKILSAKEQAQTAQIHLTREEFALKEAQQVEAALRENELKIAEYRRQTETLQKELDQPLFSDRKSIPPGDSTKAAYADPAVTLKKVRFPVAELVLGILTLFGCAAGGYLYHPLIYLGAAAASLLILIPLGVFAAKKKKQREARFLMSEAVRERNGQIQTTIEFIINECSELTAKQERIRADRKMKHPLDQRSSEEIQRHIASMKESSAAAARSQEKDQAALDEIFSSRNAASMEELRELFFKTRQRQARAQDLVKEIEQKKEDFSTQFSGFETALRAFVSAVGRMDQALAQGFPALEETADFLNQSNVFLEQSAAYLEQAKQSLAEKRRQLYEAQEKEALLQEKQKDLNELCGGRTIEQIREEAGEIYFRYEDEISERAGSLPSDESAEAQEREAEALKKRESETQIELARMKAEMVRAFEDKPELSVVIGEIKDNEKEQAAYQSRHEALTLARSQMEQAFLEMQQTFGPMVNQRTAEIFSRITAGKYRELLVSKDLNINFRDPKLDTTQDWQYLSGGTTDQVYFALRLAVAGFFADQTGGLPLFIDDAFLQYDDARTRESLIFLEEYSRTRGAQILFFTCHKTLLDLCGNDTFRIDLAEVVKP